MSGRLAGLGFPSPTHFGGARESGVAHVVQPPLTEEGVTASRILPPVRLLDLLATLTAVGVAVVTFVNLQDFVTESIPEAVFPECAVENPRPTP